MDSIPYAKEGVVVLVGYGLGCLTTGYYLVRLCTGQDLRRLGSGSLGATNAGGVIGTTGFLVRLLGDGLKGAVAMGLARELRLAPTASMFCLVAVVLGHVGLVQLGFHGGRGVAPCRGGLLVFDYGIVLVLGALAVLCLLLIRPFVLAGLAALVATPLWLFVVGFPLSSVFGLSALTLVILLAHRTHLREALGGGWLGASEERAKEAKRSVP